MARANFLKSVQIRYFSQPKHNCQLYRSLKKLRPTAIVELGVADAVRSVNLIRLAQRYSPETEIKYTGIDLFEAREADSPGLSLKAAHQRLKATGANLRLVPGDPFSAMARTANSLVGSHLLVIGHDQDPQSLEQAWFYVPRILTPDSLVYVEQSEQGEEGPKLSYQRPTVLEVQQLAKRNLRRAA